VGPGSPRAHDVDAARQQVDIRELLR